MSSSVSSSYSSPFQISGTLGVGTATLLGGNATDTTPNAGTLLAEDNSDSSGALSVLETAQSSSTLDQTTTDALAEGKLTTAQHNVIAAIGSSTTGTYDIDWSSTGTEPTTVAAIRSLGWIKLRKPTYDPATRSVTSGSYELTTIGKAIYKRTDGATATNANDASSSDSSINITV